MAVKHCCWWIALAGILACPAVAFATTPPAEPEQPQQKAGICTMEYRPVCADKGGKRQTYPNTCMARADSAPIIRRGACRD